MTQEAHDFSPLKNICFQGAPGEYKARTGVLGGKFSVGADVRMARDSLWPGAVAGESTQTDK